MNYDEYVCSELGKATDYIKELEKKIAELEKDNKFQAAENAKLKQLLEEATTMIKRCEFGLQPEFYGGKDNGSLKDCRDFLKKWVGIYER